MKIRILSEQEMINKYGQEWMFVLERSSTGWDEEMCKHLGEIIYAEIDEYSQENEYYGEGWYWQVDWIEILDSEKA
jgi:hypothetical protein